MSWIWCLLTLLVFQTDITRTYDYDKESCGRREKDFKRIVGGLSSQPWPWVGALIVINEPTVRVFCGASLISPKWAITAAHCVHNMPLDLPLEKFNRFAENGRIQILFGEEDYEEAVKSKNLKKIKSSIKMDSFNDKFYDYDLALLELEESEDLKDREPICLDDGHFQQGDVCEVMGWGSTDNTRGPFPERLRETKCPILSDSKCLELYTSSYYNDRQVCFGYDDRRKGVCSADSGGPVACKKEGVWYLAAVISAAYLKRDEHEPNVMECAMPGYYQKHTKISNPVIRHWIKEHTGI